MSAKYLSVFSPYRWVSWVRHVFSRRAAVLKRTGTMSMQPGADSQTLSHGDCPVSGQSLVEQIKRVQGQLVAAKKRFRKERRKADILYALIISLLLAIGINQWIPAGSPQNERNTVVCRLDHSGKLLCPVALEELKGKHVELLIPKDLEDMASLLSAEDKLLYSSITTLKKTITQE